jgi:hypothetical protein
MEIGMEVFILGYPFEIKPPGGERPEPRRTAQK